MPGNATQNPRMTLDAAISGHHCLVARWVSADDPWQLPETTDINLNTRANNNIVWRNVNHHRTEPFRQTRFRRSMQVQDTEATQATATIEIVPADPNPEHSVFRYMDVDVKLDRALMAAWSQARFRGTGFKRSF